MYYNELSKNKNTQMLHSELFSKNMFSSESDEDIAEAVQKALKLEELPVLLEGILQLMRFIA